MEPPKLAVLYRCVSFSKAIFLQIWWSLEDEHPFSKGVIFRFLSPFLFGGWGWGWKTHQPTARCKRRWKYCKGFWQFLGCQKNLRGFPQGKVSGRDICSREIQTEKGGGGEFLRIRSVRIGCLNGILASRSKKTRNMHHASPFFNFCWLVMDPLE